MSLISEFKTFAMKGNVIDLAVGVIIGGAFGKIVSSIVNDIIMPPLGLILGNVNFRDLKVIMQKAEPAIMEGEKVITPAIAEVTLNYGLFIQNIVDFVIIAFTIFIVIKGFNKFKKQEEVAPELPAEPSPTNEEKLLTEIRDILQSK